MACKFNINGKEVDRKGLLKEIESTPEALFTLRNRPLDWISIGEAKDIVKAWLPNAIIEGDGSWLKFIPTLIANQELNPNTDIIANIANGAIHISAIENKVIKRALIHEVIHLVHQYGMGPKWKVRLRQAVSSEIDISNMSERDIEHHLAKLMELEEIPKTKVGRFLAQLKALFNFFILNKRDIDGIVPLIRSGYFSKNVTNIEPGYTANYSDIKKHFKAFKPYILAKAWIMGTYEEIKNSSAIPLTRQEIVLEIQKRVSSESVALAKSIMDQKKFADKFKDTNPVAYKFAADKLDELTSKKIGIDMLNRPSKKRRTTVLGVIIGDIFPNSAFDTEFKKLLIDEVNNELPAYDDEVLDMVREYEDRHISGIHDETELRDASNEEAKLSSAVKDFLTFLSIKNPDKYSFNKYISSKWAFVRTMQLITEYLSISDFSNLSEQEEYDFIKRQLNYISENEPFNTWLTILVDNLTALINKVYTPAKDLPKNFTVRVKEDLVSRETRYYGFYTEDQTLDLRELNTDDLIALSKGDSVKMTFIDGSDITNEPILQRILSWGKSYMPSLTEETFITIYEHGEAVNTYNEMHNHLFSLVEKDYRIAISRYPDRQYIPRYQKAGTVGDESNIFNQIISNLIGKIMSQEVSADTLNEIIPSTVIDDKEPLTLKQTLTSPVDAIRKQGILYIINDILNLEHLTVNMPIQPSKELTKDLIKLIESIPTMSDIEKNVIYDIETKEINLEATLDEQRNYIDITLRENNRGRITRLTKLLGKNSTRLKNTSIQDANKNPVYKYVVGSFGMRLLNHLVRSTKNSIFKGTEGLQTFRDVTIPNYIGNIEMQFNSIVNGKQSINDPIVHDAHYNEFTDKAYAFRQEPERLWVSRNFIFGFLVPLIARNDKKYHQFSIQPSDGARIVATEMDILDEQQLRNVIKDIIFQQEYRQNFLNKKLLWVNLSAFNNDAVNAYLKGEGDIETAIDSTYEEISKFGEEAFNELLLPQKLILPKDSVAKAAKKLGINTTGMAEGRVQPKEETKEGIETGTVVEDDTQNETADKQSQINAAAKALWMPFYLNQYLNSYLLTQLLSGHPDNYGSADRVVKRQSGVWGPTIRPRVGKNGSAKSFRAWILSDTNITNKDNGKDRSIEAVLNQLFPKEPKTVAELLEYFNSKGFKRTDGAGFMSKKRYNDLQKGFGRAFSLGKVMKPMMFQIIEKEEYHKGFDTAEQAQAYIDSSKFKDALILKGTAVFVKVPTPVYFKYASIVLDDNLTSKYPALKKLADIMDKHEIGEVLFESSVKVGGTADTRTLSDIIAEEKPIPQNSAVGEYSNSSYGFQFNPTTKPVSTIANPSQLEYLANLLSENKYEAKAIYSALAQIYRLKKHKLDTILNKNGLSALIEKRVGGKGTERLGQLLADGATINSPVIENKAINQLGSIWNTFINKHRFKGSKLILQTAEGITKEGYELSEALNAKADKLRKYVDKFGVMVSEAIVPKEMLTPEMVQSIKDGKPVYATADLLGFRLPSSEIHSSVALRVVDFYEEDISTTFSTNVVIIPSVDMEIQGADFDVDSLFVLIREVDANGIPIGYTKTDEGFQENFKGTDLKLAKLLAEDPNNKDIQEEFIKLANNIIIENLINIAISPKNRKRMVTPISMKDFQAKGDPENGRAAIEEANKLKKINRGWRKEWDLSKIQDNFASFKAIKEGAQLIGIFATNLKLLAFLDKSVLANMPNFKYKVDLKINGHLINKIQRKDQSGKRLVWQTMDTLINLAIDNAKELTLDIYNINTKNANIVSLLVTTGVSVKTLAYLTQTPIWEQIFSDKYSTVEAGLAAFKEKHKPKMELGPTEDTKDSNEIIEVDITDEKLRSYLENYDAEIEKEILTLLVELNDTAKVLKDMSSTLILLRENPTTPEGIYSLYNKIKSLFKVSQIRVNLNPNKQPTAFLKILSPESIIFDSSYSIFSKKNEENLPILFNDRINVYYLFKNHPQIAFLFKNFLDLHTKLVSNFKSHHPRITKFLSTNYGLQSAGNVIERVETMRNGMKKFIVGNIAARMMKEDGINVDGGLNAWKSSFLEKVKLLQSYENKMEVKVAASTTKTLWKRTYNANQFIKSLIIDKDPETFRDRIRMEVQNNFDGDTGLILQDAFDDLIRYEIVDGEVIVRTDIRPGERDSNNFNLLQREFMYYTMLTTGLSSGSTNYSSFMNPKIYSNVNAEIEKIYNRLARDKNIKGFIESNEIKMLLQNLNLLPEVSVRTENEEGTVYNENSPVTLVKTKGAPKILENKGVYTHTDGREIHYDLRFKTDDASLVSPVRSFLDLTKEEEELRDEERTKLLESGAIQTIPFYPYIRKGKSLYKLVFDTNKEVFYVRVGSKRDIDTSIVEDPFEFNPYEKFSPDRKYLPLESKMLQGNKKIEISIEGENLDPYINKTVLVYDKNNIFRKILHEYTVTKQDNKYILTYKEEYKGEAIKKTESASLVDTLNKIAENGVLPSFKRIAARLAAKLQKSNTVINLSPNSRGSTSAIFKLSGNSVTIYNTEKKSQHELQISILHEAIHAATIDALMNDTEFQRRLQEIFDKWKAFLFSDAGKPYREKLEQTSKAQLEAVLEEGPIELITYGLTEDEFVEHFSSITPQQIGLKSRIVNLFKELLVKLGEALGILDVEEDTNLYHELLFELERYLKSKETELIGLSSVDAVYLQVESESNENTTNESKSFIKTLREEGDKWSEVPATKDEEGNIITEADGVTPRIIEYTDGVTTVTRLTDSVRGFINKFRRDPYTKYIDNKTYEEADSLWKDKKPEEKLFRPDVSETPVDKETFIKLKEQKRKKFANLGTASHLMIQAFVNKLMGKDSSKYIQEAHSMLEEVGMNSNAVNWVYQKALKILERSGVDLQNDVLESEIRVASKIWGVGSTIDLLIKHIDDTFSIVDFKFGKNLNTAISSRLFKFGVQDNIDIFEKRKNIAKLEVMLRALILKTEHPDIKFKNLMVVSVPSKHSVDHFSDNSRHVEVHDYLKLIKENLEAEYNNAVNKEETVYGKLKNLPHFNRIFDPKEYTSGVSSKLIKEGETTNIEALYRKKLDQLRYAVQYDLDRRTLEGMNERSNRARLRKEEAVKLAEELLQLKHKAKIDDAGWNKDISWMGMYIGSMRDLDSSLVNVYQTLYTQQHRIAARRWEAALQIYRNKVRPVRELYYKRKQGINYVKPITQDVKALEGYVTNIDPVEFWEWAYTYDPLKEDHITGVLATEKEWKEAAKRFPYLLNEKNEIRQEYRDLLDYILNSYEQFLVDSKSFYGKALANKPATYRKVQGTEKLVTNLELHLYPEGNIPEHREPFYTRGGFFPKVPVTKDELASLFGQYNPFNVNMWKYQWRYVMTSYIESEFLQWNNKVEGLPFRYFGNEQILEEKNYSVDMEAQFMQFVKYHIYKEEMEDVYAMGKGLSYLADSKDLDRTHKWFEKSIALHIQGKKQLEFGNEFFGRQVPIMSKPKGDKEDAITRAKRLNFVQIIRALKHPASLAVMGLKPFQGTANGIFTFLYTLKEGVKDSLIERQLPGLKGIDQGFVNFTSSDIALGAKEFARMQKDIAMGNMEKNKTWLLMKELNYVPNHFLNFANKKRGEIHRGRLFDESSLYVFHSAPEEFMATVIMVAQMKRTKIKTKDQHNGKSLWDMYHVNEDSDKEGNKFYNLKWGVKNKKGEIENYIRFYQDNGTEVVPVSELTPDEINRMYYVYQKMHGGYRPEERSILEYYVLGELFMQFRKFLTSVLRNVSMGRHTNLTYGQYKPKMVNGQPVEMDGKEVMRWTGRVMEGRFKVLAGLMLNFFSIRGELAPSGGFLTAIRKWIGLQEVEAYDWTKMTDYQRDVVLDFFVTFGFLMGMLGVIIGMGADYDEEDPLMVFMNRVKDNFMQQWDPIQLVKDITSTTPVAGKILYYRVEAGADLIASAFYYAMGDKERALTEQGTPVGLNRTLKYMPYIASWYDFARYFLGMETVDAETLPYLRKVSTE